MTSQNTPTTKVVNAQEFTLIAWLTPDSFLCETWYPTEELPYLRSKGVLFHFA